MSFVGNTLIAGSDARSGTPIVLRPDDLAKHVYVCGSTGAGKSKFLEHLCRQHIYQHRNTGASMLLLDPHGAVYESLLRWCARYRIKRPIIPVNVGCDRWITSYNLLRRRHNTTVSSAIDAIVQGIANVWGAADTDKTPLMARWMSNLLQLLYDNEFTLADALQVLQSRELRGALASRVTNSLAARDWHLAGILSAKDLEFQIGSTVNRLHRFLRNEQLRASFGQPIASLDFAQALDEGAIILMNLATEGGRVSRENVNLFGTLTLTDLWTAAQQRGKRKKLRPMYVIADEFYRFLTPSMAESLDEARGFGIHVTVAQQFLGQLTDRDDAGTQVAASIMENASTKFVFRMSDERNLRPMAQWLHMAEFDPDEVKHQSYATRVLHYQRELRRSRMCGRSVTNGETKGTNELDGESVIDVGGSESRGTTRSKQHTEGSNTAALHSETESENITETPVDVPVLGKEALPPAFRPLEEQLFRRMVTLFRQNDRCAVGRIVGQHRTVELVVPSVKDPPVSEERCITYVDELCGSLPFMVRRDQAMGQLAHRDQRLRNMLQATLVEDEPDSGPVRGRRATLER